MQEYRQDFTTRGGFALIILGNQGLNLSAQIHVYLFKVVFLHVHASQVWEQVVSLQKSLDLLLVQSVLVGPDLPDAFALEEQRPLCEGCRLAARPCCCSRILLREGPLSVVGKGEGCSAREDRWRCLLALWVPRP